MEKEDHPSLKSKNQQKKRGNVWVRRSTRGPKNLTINFDECFHATGDEDTVENTDDSGLAEIAESKDAVKSKTDDDREHASLDPTSVVRTENDIKFDDGSSITLKDEKRKENEAVCLVDGRGKGKKRKKPRKHPQVEEDNIDYTVGAIKRKRGRPRKILLNQGSEEGDDCYFDAENGRRTQMESCHDENESNDHLGGTEKKTKRKPKKSSQGEEETVDCLGDIEKKKKGKPRKTSQGEEEKTHSLGDVDKKKKGKQRKTSQGEEETTDSIGDIEKKKIGRPRKINQKEEETTDIQGEIEKKKGKQRKTSQGEEEETTDIQGEIEEKKGKQRKTSQGEEETTDSIGDIEKKKIGRPRKINQKEEETTDIQGEIEKKKGKQRKTSQGEEEETTDIQGEIEKKKGKQRKTSQGEEETTDSIGDIEKKKIGRPRKINQKEEETTDIQGEIEKKKGKQRKTSQGEEEETTDIQGEIEKKKGKQRKTSQGEEETTDSIGDVEKKKIGRPRKINQKEEETTDIQGEIEKKKGKQRKTSQGEEEETTDVQGEIEKKKGKQRKTSQGEEEETTDIQGEIEKKKGKQRKTSQGEEETTDSIGDIEKKKGKQRKTSQGEEETTDSIGDIEKKKIGRPRKINQKEEEITGSQGEIEKKKKGRPRKKSQGEEERNNYLGDTQITNRGELKKTSQSEEEMDDCVTDTEKKKKRKGRKIILKDDGSKDNVIQAKKRKGKIGRPRKNVQIEEKNVNESVILWRDSFASKIFKCINTTCLQNFITWAGLFDHFHKCEFSDEVKSSVILPCHVCRKDFPFKPDFVKHIRLQHRDVYDLVHGLESGNTTHCFNYKCSAEVKTYEDCIQHGAQCGSLVLCDKCGRSYKTRLYFSSHSCIAEKSEETKVPKKDDFLSSLGEMGKRKAAKRALSAIYSNDSEDAIGSSSNQLDNEFQASSGSDEDSAEYEDDDDDDDVDDDNLDDDDGGIDHESRSQISHTSVQDIATNFTSLLKNSQRVDRRRIKPYKKDKNWLTSWYKKNQSSFAFPEWRLSKNDIQFLSECEAAEYLPPWSISPLFNVIYEKQNQHACKTEFKQLRKFEVLHLEDSSITTMFVGGSVAGIEWCPNKGTCDQFLAVTTVGSYAKITERNKNKELIQIWRVPNQPSPSNTVELSMLIAVEFGPVHCIKWHPSSSVKDDDSDEVEMLGVLALSCDDGCVRILSVPHPSSLEDQTQQKTNGNARITVKHKTVLILAPNRKNLQTDQSSNKVTCNEWQPNDGHKQLAAGFLDGTICIWNLKCKSPILRISRDKENCDVLLPFSKINAHSYCVNSLSWCPTDANFIVSVSFEKSLKIFDIREKYASPIISLKRHMFEKCVFLLRICAVSAVEDELSNNLPVGSRFLDFIYQTLAKVSYTSSDHITSHKATCMGIANSEWMNAIVTCCCGGEVMFRALAHESQRDRSCGKSFRLPVYHIEISNVTASEEEALEIDNCATEARHLSLSDKSSEDASVKEIIKKRAEQLPIKIFKHKFTFKDSNFFEFRNKPRQCAFEVNRIRCFKPNEQSNFSDDEMLQISQAQWNPNYGQHFVLATGGTLGFVRLHYFTNWK